MESLAIVFFLHECFEINLIQIIQIHGNGTRALSFRWHRDFNLGRRLWIDCCRSLAQSYIRFPILHVSIDLIDIEHQSTCSICWRSCCTIFCWFINLRCKLDLTRHVRERDEIECAIKTGISLTSRKWKSPSNLRLCTSKKKSPQVVPR